MKSMNCYSNKATTHGAVAHRIGRAADLVKNALAFLDAVAPTALGCDPTVLEGHPAVRRDDAGDSRLRHAHIHQLATQLLATLEAEAAVAAIHRDRQALERAFRKARREADANLPEDDGEVPFEVPSLEEGTPEAG